MAERDDLLASIAAKTADYREGDHPAPTPDHVGRWISQFDAAVRLPMLREVDFVLQRTYFSKQEIENELADHVRVIGDGGNDLDDADAIAFWRGTEILNIQQRGRSQADINEIFAGALLERFGLVRRSRPSTAGTGPMSLWGWRRYASILVSSPTDRQAARSASNTSA